MGVFKRKSELDSLMTLTLSKQISQTAQVRSLSENMNRGPQARNQEMLKKCRTVQIKIE